MKLSVQLTSESLLRALRRLAQEVAEKEQHRLMQTHRQGEAKLRETRDESGRT